jgi:ATPase subunit of ABC transporter with duplicated ATPase domains
VAKQKRLELERRKDAVLSKQLKSELDWIHKTPSGRQTKSKSRIERFEELRDQQKKKTYEPGVIVIPPGPRLGKDVINVQSISKSVSLPNGDKRPLFSNLSFRVLPGSIIGIVGPNGSGKTSLLKILAGEEKADSGEVTVGQTVRLGYASQNRDALNPKNTVYEEIAQGAHELSVGDYNVALRQYVATFNFKSGQQDKLVANLSGGERNRVHLAKMLKSSVNVILLDEPTNDIDIEVLRSLEEGMQDYPGCFVVVSHDRWFLDRVATHILAFEDDKTIFFEGNFSQYDKDRKQNRGGKEQFVFTNISKRGTW